MKYSVLMSVYKNEKVEFFCEALDSILSQSVKPSQIVLVRDGEVYDELQKKIDEYISKNSSIFTYLPLEKNGGLGEALRYGLEHCKYELVGRMDTDDIAVEDRFERQIDFLGRNPDVDIVGGDISEFANSPSEVIDYRIVPKTHEEIVEYMKSRSPFNHVTVMFKKSSVEKAGSYKGFYLFEDWYLWLRMYLSNAKFSNLDSVLVNVRVSDMSNRRGGLKYYKSCSKLFAFMKNEKIISRASCFKSKLVRFVVYVLFPNKFRELMYKKILRKKKYNGN